MGLFDWSKRERRGRRSAGRIAGVISGPDAAPPPAALPEVGNFASRERTAFWQFGTTLALTSGANILRDTRRNLNIDAGTVGYTTAVLNAVIADVQRRLNGVNAPERTLPPEPGHDPNTPELSIPMLQWVIWSTYHNGGTHPVSLPTDVILPRRLILPSINTDASAVPADFPVRFYPGVTGEYYATNPFTGTPSPAERVGVIRGPVIDVTGAPPRRESSSNTGLWLVAALAAVGLAAKGGK